MKKDTTVKRSIFARKKMDDGGSVLLARKFGDLNIKSPIPQSSTPGQWANKNQLGSSSAADLAATAVNAFAPTDAYGVRSNGAALGSGALKGAATGAAIGSTIPVIGTIAGGAVGAVVGGVSGILGNKSANAKKTAAINQSTAAQLASMEQGAEARIAGDPSLKYGNRDASYYRFGGTMKGTGPTPPRNMPAMPAVQGKPRLMPNISTAPARQISRMAQGGSIEPMSSQDVKVEGPSHAAGGVPIPSMGVELEGGETVNNGFVFSKKLGFAKPAEAIAKQLGKAEARPENSINKATVAALQRKTELLKVHQESAKQAVGIPNDLTKKADGGPIQDASDPGYDRWRKSLPKNLQEDQDYDLQGYYKKYGTKGPAANEHLTDEFKRPNHVTFSNESIYSKPSQQGGVWGTQNGKDTFTPSSYNIKNVGPDSLRNYFKKNEPTAKLIMADGGPIMRSDTTVNRNSPTYDPTLLATNGKFMVSKPNGSMGQWGNELPIVGNSPAIPLPTMVAPLRMSDKARSLSNSFYPANNNAANPTPAAIKSPTGRTYKFGGNMKKMAEGGKDPLYPNSAIPYMDVPNFTGSTPVISGLPFTRDQQIPVTQKPAITPVPLTAPATLQGKTLAAPVPEYTLPETKPDGVMDAFNKVSPFISNIANAANKLPLPPVPVLNTELTPNLVDYSASRAEAVRTNRGADKTARQNLNTGAAVAASTAANLSQRVRSVGQINEAENNANTGIRNQVASQNAQVKMGNTALQNNYQNELVSRQLKGQQLKSENMANVEQKIQGMARDKKLDNLEGTKVMLTALSDPTGASWRGAEPLFKSLLSPEEYQQAKAHFAKVTTNYESGRTSFNNWANQNPDKASSDNPYFGYMGVGAPSTIQNEKKSSSKSYKDANGVVHKEVVRSTE
jgi:hypothetical protein